jgi:hypothetical protein
MLLVLRTILLQGSDDEQEEKLLHIVLGIIFRTEFFSLFHPKSLCSGLIDAN